MQEHEFVPWSRKVPHAMEQLSPQEEKSPQEAHNPNWRVSHTDHNKRKAHAAMKTQHSQKINN